jgi:hypothetical protein
MKGPIMQNVVDSCTAAKEIDDRRTEDGGITIFRIVDKLV